MDVEQARRDTPGVGQVVHLHGIRFEPGDGILTARSEYASNVIAVSQVADHSGAVIEGIATHDLPHRAPAGLVRASVHYDNTHDEIDQLIRALRSRRDVAL